MPKLIKRAKLHLDLLQHPFTLDSVIFPVLKIPGIELSAIDLTTQLTPRITLKIPLVSSPMDTVTGSEMAILMASQGGIGVIHFNYPTIEDQMREVEKVRRFAAGFIKDPVVLPQTATVGDVFAQAKIYGFHTYPVTIDGTLNTPLVGIITHHDVRYLTDMKQPIVQVMTPADKLITAPRKTTLDKNDIATANQILKKYNLETLPIIDTQKRIVALVTDRDISKTEQYPLATKDGNKQYKVLVAVESRLELAEERIIAARDSGASGIVVDARNLYQDHLKIAKFTRKQAPELDIIIGNVVMPETVKMVMEEIGDCVDAFRVGIGTGEVCTTTEELGIGRALGTAVYEIDQVLRPYHKKYGPIGLIADGGIKSSKHIVAAMMLGASSVMMGSGLAGFDESPARKEFSSKQGMMVAKVRGMGSAEVINERAGGNRYMLQNSALRDRIPEGIEKTTAYKGEGADQIRRMMNGIRQTMHGLGHANFQQLYQDAYLEPILKAESKGTLS